MNFRDNFNKIVKVGDIIQLVNRLDGQYFKVFPRYDEGICYLVGESTVLSDWVLDDVEKYEECLEWFEDNDIIKIISRNGKDFNGGYIKHNDELKNFELVKSITEIKGK